MKENTKQVRILIPVFNGIEYLKKAVDSLFRTTDREIFELIIIDNASTDGAKEYALKVEESLPDTVRVIMNQENKGYAGGMNTALKAIEQESWDYVVFGNSDLIFTKEWLKDLINLQKSKARPNIGMVGPVSNAAGGSQGISVTYKKEDEIEDFAATRRLTHGNKFHEQAWVVGLCLLATRQCIEDTKDFICKDRWFDEWDGKHYMWEDNDLCLRARMKGYNLIIAEGIFVHHGDNKGFNTSFRGNKISAAEHFHMSRKFYQNKWKDYWDKNPQKLVGMCRVKNGDRWLERVLTRISEFCDEIVILVDQHSTDNSYEICKKFPKVIDLQKEKPHKYNESYSRNYVFDMAKKRSPNWIYCLSGDTKIPLIDSSTKTIKELSELSSWNDLYAYSFDKEKGQIVPGKINNVWKTGAKRTIKITLDNNESFKCTPDHLIMLRNGSYKKAGDLKEGVGLMPLYRKFNVPGLPGYELLYHPGEDKWHFSHRSFWNYYNPKNLWRGHNTCIHHIDFNSLNNSASNLKLMTKKEHFSYHGREWTKEHLENLKKALRTPEERKKNSERRKLKFEKMTKEERYNYMMPAMASCLTLEARRKKSENKKKYYASLSEEEKSRRGKHAWENISPEKRSEIQRRGWDTRRENAQVLNHTIVKIEECGTEDVYDMTIEKHHNFAIGFNDKSGVFVHNCFDCDEVPEERIKKDVKRLMNPADPHTMCWTFPIIQFWNSETHYRTDGLWGNFLQGRMFRYCPGQKIGGGGEAMEQIHCGSHPWFPGPCIGRSLVRILHYGNVDPKIRQKKYEWYTKTDTKKEENVGMILGNHLPYYKNLYGKKEFEDRDYYRHIVDETGLQLRKFVEHTGISLCQIAKNEAKYISQSITSVASICDELIVVDTGSMDGTPDIAEGLGARVFQGDPSWNNEKGRLKDYSMARNASLKKASNKWILRIDPDEMVDPKFVEKIYELTLDENVDGFLFPIMNFIEDPRKNKDAKWVLSETCRLFKNSPDIKYKGLVHEELDDSLKELSKKRKVHIKKVPYPIYHFGYLRPAKFKQDKWEHYCNLGEQQKQITPLDARNYFSTAVHYFHEGDWDKAVEGYKKTIELDARHFMAFNDLAVICFNRGQIEEARKFFLKAKSCLTPTDHAMHHQKIDDNLRALELKSMAMMMV